ncbi:MAG TPA: choice-of-anchor Q domain-containing protein, partial [Bacteroidia bacterium]|nr:choice-of-anchor Q domain-containing protein [Bacteroidia bacterium]
HTSTELHNNFYFSSVDPLFKVGDWTYSDHHLFSVDLGSDTNSLFEDPLFSDLADYNFHLQGGSPAIDAGEMNYLASYSETDMDSMTRVQNGRVDAGADEYGTAVGIEVPAVNAAYSFLFDRATNDVSVSFTQPCKGLYRNVMLYSSDGKTIEIKQRTGPAETLHFNVSSLPPGTYMIFLQAESVAWKFVK